MDSNLHLLAVIYKDKSFKGIIGFYIYSDTENKSMAASYDSVVNVIKSGKSSVNGLVLENGELKGSNGALSRYTKVVEGKPIGDTPLIILNDVSGKGYDMVHFNGKRAKLRDEDAITYAKKYGLANGKIVSRDGKEFISSISGSYVEAKIEKPVEREKANPSESISPIEKNADSVDKKQVRDLNKIAGGEGLGIVDTSLKDDMARELQNLSSKAPIVRGEECDDKYLLATDSEGYTASDKLFQVMRTIKLARPFYGMLFNQMRRIPTLEIETAGVTVKDFFYNPLFILSVSLPEATFIGLHELCHVIMQHPSREKSRDHEMWNVACDFYVNKFISDTFGLNTDKNKKKAVDLTEYREGGGSGRIVGSIILPDNCLFNDKVNIDKDTPESLYDELMKNLQEETSTMNTGSNAGGGNGNGAGSSGSGGEDGDEDGEGSSGAGSKSGKKKSGNQKGQGQSGQGKNTNGKKVEVTVKKRRTKLKGQDVELGDNIKIDIVDTPETASMSPEQKEQRGASVVQQAATATKQAGGHIDSASERFLTSILAPKVNWKQLLRNYLIKASAKENSFSAPDRRFISRGMTLPGPKAKDPDSLGNIKICVDTSGSISDKELGQALNMMEQLFKTYKAEGELIYWDTAVRAVYPFKDVKELLAKKPYGGGGTDVNCVFNYFTSGDYAKKKKKFPNVVVIITDGCFGTVDQDYARKFKNTMWVINSNLYDSFTAPFGKKATLTPD